MKVFAFPSGGGMKLPYILLWCICDFASRYRTMTRLTITLSDERHWALKEAALNRRKSIASLIEESPDFYGLTSSPA